MLLCIPDVGYSPLSLRFASSTATLMVAIQKCNILECIRVGHCFFAWVERDCAEQTCGITLSWGCMGISISIRQKLKE